MVVPTPPEMPPTGIDWTPPRAMMLVSLLVLWLAVNEAVYVRSVPCRLDDAGAQAGLDAGVPAC